MTDIVERLRDSLKPHPATLLRNADLAEAANEIERLRAALEPFAKAARRYAPFKNERHYAELLFRLSELRDAHTALCPENR